MTSTSRKLSMLLISATILFIAGWANLATAVVVEGSFTGVVTTTFISTDGSTITYNVTTPVGVQVGDHVTGYFTYDTNGATDMFPSDPTNAEYVYNPAGANSFYIEINGLRWASGNTLSIQVQNNHFFDFNGSYQSLFDIQFLDAGSSFPGNQLAGQGAVTFQIANIFNSTPNTLLKSDQLPTSLSDIDLSAANDTTVYVLSDYPTYPPGRYGFFVSIDRNSIRLAPRLCDVAAANPALLWPPNHKLVPVAIVGVTDPDGDPITLTVTSVTQDEPVNGLGDGDTSPDAAIQGSRVKLRAERAGPLNGRVYQVNFTADDGRLGQCSGSVSVCVPHDQRGASCINDGQLYNSTQP